MVIDWLMQTHRCTLCTLIMIHACGICVRECYPLWVTLPSHPKCVDPSTRPAKDLDAIDAFGGEQEISTAFGQGPQSVFEWSLVDSHLGKTWLIHKIWYWYGIGIKKWFNSAGFDHYKTSWTDSLAQLNIPIYITCIFLIAVNQSRSVKPSTLLSTHEQDQLYRNHSWLGLSRPSACDLRQAWNEDVRGPRSRAVKYCNIIWYACGVKKNIV